MKSELEKIKYNTKTYVGMIGLSFLPVLLWLAIEAGFEAEQSYPNSPELDGWQMVIRSMNFAMHIFAPLIIAMMASDTVSLEAATGTLTLSLTKPVSRQMYLIKKILSQGVLTFIFFIAFAFSSLFIGYIIGYDVFYGVEFYGPSSINVIIPEDEIWWRIILFFSFAALGCFVVAILAISLSPFTNSGTTVSSVTFIIFMITEIGGGVLKADYAKYLLSPAMKRMVWSVLFLDIDWDIIFESLLILTLYSIFSLFLAFMKFTKKDI
ncbi:MAG: ABC transporter permease [Candidatus Heimdallarchaeota archaeon]|nr:ABC transporter permease [Candidatus Heimdallarchaeota archaeon]MDH5645972.1 ABC transporter permease [Candidatus Heimdallarchaeota archaeon]